MTKKRLSVVALVAVLLCTAFFSISNENKIVSAATTDNFKNYHILDYTQWIVLNGGSSSSLTATGLDTNFTNGSADIYNVNLYYGNNIYPITAITSSADESFQTTFIRLNYASNNRSVAYFDSVDYKILFYIPFSAVGTDLTAIDFSIQFKFVCSYNNLKNNLYSVWHNNQNNLIDTTALGRVKSAAVRTYTQFTGNEGFQNGYLSGFENGKIIGHENGYSVGKRDGLTVGQEIGYTDGYNNGVVVGQSNGKDIGYSVGYNDGLIDGADTNITTGWFASFMGGFAAIFSIQIFPNITLGLLVGLPLVLGLIFFIIRLKKGD